MTPERWQKVEEVFGHAVALAEPERSAYVQHVCGADEALRSEVMSLLASASGGSGVMRGAIGAAAAAIVEHAPDPDRMLGEMVGSYQVKRKLGEGGMGVVYIAEHPLLRKQAVVKFLHAELSTKPDIVERFFNEARSATLIRHPGIVDVFDFGHHRSGCAFILMEFLDGESLADRIRKGRIEPGVAILIGRQIAAALGAAHERGIVHRDLKPDNVFLVLDRDAPAGARIKVLDFGIAKLAGEAAGAVKTHTGAVMGTPSYMAPEQCRSAGQVDHRADIYALGCILFELMCGRPPFSTQSLGQLIAAHMFEPPPAPSSLAPVPADLEAVILRSLAKDPAHRQPSMAELSSQLAACASSGPVEVWAGVTKPGSAPAQDLAFAATAAGAGSVPGQGPIAAAVDPMLDGSTQPSPAHRTTLGGAVGQVSGAARRRSRRWLGVAAAAVIAAGSVFVWQLASGSSTETRSAHASLDAAPQAGDAFIPPPPPDAARVTIVIESVPPGAAVIQEHDGVRVGQTRFERSVAPVAGGTLVYLLKLDGHEDARVEVEADRDVKRMITLKRRAVATKPPKPIIKPAITGSAPTQPPKDPPKSPAKPCPPGILCPK